MSRYMAGALWVLTIWQSGAGQTAARLQLSGACKPKLRIAYLAVEDMDPLASNYDFSNQLAEAKRSLREAAAVASTRGDKLAAEEIETYRIQREACRPTLSAEGYRDCEKTAAVTGWQVSYGIGIAKNPPRPEGSVR